MKTQLKILGLGAVSAFLLVGPVLAQTAPPTHAGTGLPYCSAKMADKCIQRSDAKRIDAEKAAAAKAM